MWSCIENSFDCGIHSGAGRNPERDFTLDRVHGFVTDHTIEPHSLEPYLIFRTSHYTRNLLERTNLYEILAIC